MLLNDPIRVISLVLAKFLSAAKAIGTNVDAGGFTNRVGTSYSNSLCEVCEAAVTFDEETGVIGYRRKNC